MRTCILQCTDPISAISVSKRRNRLLFLTTLCSASELQPDHTSWRVSPLWRQDWHGLWRLVLLERPNTVAHRDEPKQDDEMTFDLPQEEEELNVRCFPTCSDTSVWLWSQQRNLSSFDLVSNSAKIYQESIKKYLDLSSHQSKPVFKVTCLFTFNFSELDRIQHSSQQADVHTAGGWTRQQVGEEKEEVSGVCW